MATRSSFHDGLKVDLGDGDEAGDGAYQKPVVGPDPHRGTVYTVAGNGGLLSGGTLDHPAILASFNELGSMVLDVNGLRVDCLFLDSTGAIRDRFTMTKGPTLLAPVAQIGVDPPAGTAPLAVRLLDRSRNVPDSWSWDFQDDGFVDSVVQNPMHTYSTPGLYSISLEVSNANGTDQTVATDLVCVTAGIPEPVEKLRFDDETTFSWEPAGGAGARYDALRGDLTLLRSGDLSGSQLACPVADTQGTSAVDMTPVAVGLPYYYLVRARNCAAESGSYDSFGPGQAGSRDLGLQGSGASCSCAVEEDGDGDGICANLDNCPALASTAPSLAHYSDSISLLGL